MPPFAAHGARTSIMSIRAVTNPRGKRTNEGSFAAAGRGMIYLCFLFRSGGFCPLCKSQFCPCPYKIRQPYCPPRSVCPLPICPGCRCRRQPLPGVSRKQRYNTLDFPWESRVPRKALPSFGNLSPRGTLFPSGLPACPCSGYPSCSHTMDALLPEQVKQAQRFARAVGKFLCLFLFSGGWAKHTQNPRSWLEIFVLECEN